MHFSFMRQLALCVLATFSITASATNLKMLSSWDSSHSASKHIAYVFQDIVKEKSDGDINIKAFGPEVVPAGKQVQPVSAGVFDLLFTHGLYHTGVTGIGAAIDAVDKDIEKRRESGVWDWIDNYYSKKQNLKVIAIAAAPSGYRLLLRRPMPESGSLKGQKIRALPSYRAIIERLQAIPTVVPFGELYSSVEKGIVDGMIWTGVGVIGYKYHEVAPNLIDPVFGSVSYLVLMNLDKWNDLSENEKKLLLDAGYELEKKTVATFTQLLKDEDEAMLKDGAKKGNYVDLSQEELEDLFRESAMSVAIEQSGEDGIAFRDFVRSKGL